MYYEIPIKIYRMYPNVRLPTKGTPFSVGIDIYAHLKSENGQSLTIVIPPNTTRAVRTGVIVVVGEPYSIFVCSRSGMAKERTLFVTNSPGVVDPDYRGEIIVLLHNGGTQNQWVTDGDRIAQLVPLPTPIAHVEESETDPRTWATIRGEKGFGSTGR